MGLVELFGSYLMDALHACDIVYCLEWAASAVCAYVLSAAWQWRRRDCPDRSQGDSDAKKKFHSHVIIDKSYLLRPIGECNFGLFPNLILHNRAIRLCSMQYAKMRRFR